MKEMFQTKETYYDMRDNNKLIQPKFNKVRYGRNTFACYGAHLWNLLPTNIKVCTDIKIFKQMLNLWQGPNCQCALCVFNT